MQEPVGQVWQSSQTLQMLMYNKLHAKQCFYLLMMYMKKASQKVKTSVLRICTRVTWKKESFSANHKRAIFHSFNTIYSCPIVRGSNISLDRVTFLFVHMKKNMRKFDPSSRFQPRLYRAYPIRESGGGEI